jgi:mycothiol maleylpyruvate isomerase-like protein
MNADRVYARTTRNRLEIADVLDSLDPEHWQAPTLCEGWTVRHVAAHLIQPILIGFGRFFLVAVRHRGNTPATVDHFARAIARREPSELLDLLTYLTSPDPAPSLATPQRIAGLMLVATDAEWRQGSGPRVAGSLEALTMAITGRQAALDDLDGPGVATLRARL